MQGMRIKCITVVVGVILLIPLVLMLLDSSSHLRGGEGGGADWELGDFILMGALLFATGLAIDFAIRKITNGAKNKGDIGTSFG